MNKILGIVVARGGSKGIHRKNLQMIGGRSLIEIVTHEALQSKYIDTLILSSDDQEILDHGKKAGLETPFIRPTNLASDASPVIETIIHAIDWYKNQGVEFDFVVLFQPSSPFLSVEILDQGLSDLILKDADTLITAYEANHSHPRYLYKPNSSGEVVQAFPQENPSLRRQDAEKYLVRAGLFYAAKLSVIMQNRSLYGDKIIAVEIPEYAGLCIDTPEDLELARYWNSKIIKEN